MSTRNFLIMISTAAVVGATGTSLINHPNNQGKVLGLQVGPTPTAIPTATPVPTATPTPTAKPTPRPTRIPTPTLIPQPKYTSEQIYNFINEFSGKYGVNADVMRHMAICETGFNPMGRNGIYAGLFQFDAPTWSSFRKMMGKDPNPDIRYNAKEVVETVAYMLSIHREALWPNCYPR